MNLIHNNSQQNGKKIWHQRRFFFRHRAAVLPFISTLLLISLLFSGCSGTRPTYRQQPDNSATSPGAVKDEYLEKFGALRNDLANLNRQTNMQEARQVAETAITYSSDLAEKYSLVRPAILHNVLVRIGLKDRGLCYHWTEDLMKQLQLLDLKSYQLHWGVAYRGSELREHNSVVITARGEAFEKGMILDPWRNSGDLYWALIQTDTYPWVERPAEEW